VSPVEVQNRSSHAIAPVSASNFARSINHSGKLRLLQNKKVENDVREKRKGAVKLSNSMQVLPTAATTPYIFPSSESAILVTPLLSGRHHAVIIVVDIVFIVILLTQTAGLDGTMPDHRGLGILGVTIHGAAVAAVPGDGEGEDAVASTLSHVHDVLPECILGVVSAGANRRVKAVMSYLLSPVLETFLPRVITLTAMEEEQRDKGTKHAYLDISKIMGT
jgi:hypothetical protein